MARCFCVLLAFAIAAGPSFGQAQERYLVNARAGEVNFLSGQVWVSRAAGGQNVLLRQDFLEAGDEAITGEGVYIEVLLNPGSYLRLAPNSRFRFISTSLEDTRVELLSGSAMLEINADNNFSISVAVPATTVRIDHSGIYRFDLTPPPGDLEVIKGRAVVGGTELKAGKRLKLEPGATAEKFDPKYMDEFAEWSDSRAKELARVTNAVEAEALDRSLGNSYTSGVWDFYQPYSGLWIWDASYRCAFYLPFNGHHHHWPYPYYSGHPFNWDKGDWARHRRHDRDRNSGDTVRIAKTLTSHGEHFNSGKHSNESRALKEAKRIGVSQPTPVATNTGDRPPSRRDSGLGSHGGSGGSHHRWSGSGGGSSGGGGSSTGASSRARGGSFGGHSGGSHSSGGSSGAHSGGNRSSSSSGSNSSGSSSHSRD